mmetsp:Transcript_139143/g.444518  ORF Transcript_139143/g.444518 Transcript_139143/m.444518 type:complete len:200 (+) Transcript_139143:8400-8999(+)
MLRAADVRHASQERLQRSPVNGEVQCTFASTDIVGCRHGNTAAEYDVGHIGRRDARPVQLRHVLAAERPECLLDLCDGSVTRLRRTRWDEHSRSGRCSRANFVLQSPSSLLQRLLILPQLVLIPPHCRLLRVLVCAVDRSHLQPTSSQLGMLQAETQLPHTGLQPDQCCAAVHQREPGPPPGALREEPEATLQGDLRIG